MQPWKLRVFVTVLAAISLIPMAVVLPLWARLRRQILPKGRRILSTAGLALATLACITPPVWLTALELLAHLGENSPLANGTVEAALTGLVVAVVAAILLFFAKDRVRSGGLLACGLTLLLFALSLVLSYGMGRM
jgi:MFS family permease